jgi:hypothetical protein
VKIVPPSWYLTEICPCCEQGGLTFSTCPTCGLVVLICAEIGSIFAISGRRCGPLIGSIDSDQTCQKCGASDYLSFRDSSSDEIRALGFQPGDYC